MSLARVLVGVTLSCMVALPGWALASDPPGHGGAVQPQQNDQPASAQPAYLEGFGQAVSASTLGHYSGGSSNVQSTQNINGAVTGNSAERVTTGNNMITGDSFSGASGLPSVIQNTGNNVLIQNGVIVNVQLKP
ncbi:MAG TPA: hypothetical protein VME63_01895 [Dyella sp.]|uniref:hypothetical protein n=1 Tax=Dyella sp. TaxID=1869338 RepID=UPI002C5A1DE5|nr:hypothetical protein [Dyella sp.]HTV84125.1 hypothetical protein [Dyella sp.]